MLLYSLCLALCLLLVVAGDMKTNLGPISGKGKHYSGVLWSGMLELSQKTPKLGAPP